MLPENHGCASRFTLRLRRCVTTIAIVACTTSAAQALDGNRAGVEAYLAALDKKNYIEAEAKTEKKTLYYVRDFFGDRHDAEFSIIRNVVADIIKAPVRVVQREGATIYFGWTSHAPNSRPSTLTFCSAGPALFVERTFHLSWRFDSRNPPTYSRSELASWRIAVGIPPFHLAELLPVTARRFQVNEAVEGRRRGRVEVTLKSMSDDLIAKAFFEDNKSAYSAIIADLGKAGVALESEASLEDLFYLHPSSDIIDITGSLSDYEMKSLAERCAGIDAQTGYQIVVVLVPSTGSLPLDEVSQRLFNAWGIGHGGKGFLILLAINDRKSRVEIGRDAEPVMSSAQASEVLAAMRDSLRQVRYSDALNRGIDVVVRLLQPGDVR